MLSVRCLSDLSCLNVCLSTTLVYCGQMIGWIKMKLGMEVGLCPAHIVLDRDPAPPPQIGTAPNFRPCLLWPNGWIDQDATWYGGRPRPRPHSVTWEPKNRGGAASPLFGPCIYCGQTTGWIKMPLCTEAGLSSGHIVLDGDPAPGPQRGTAPNIRPMSIVAKRLDGSICHLVRK